MPFGFRIAPDTLPSGIFRAAGSRSALAVSGFRLRARLGFSIPVLSRPARRYPRFRIRPSSSERRGDFNPHDSRAAQRTIWSGPTPIRDAANYGCPSFAAPAGDHRRTRMGLIGSGMGLLAVTWSKPPVEHPVSRMTRPDVLLSLVRAPALPPPHADFGSQFHTPSNRCLRFGPRVAATPARLAPVLPARL
jgi:hypothetical protein